MTAMVLLASIPSPSFNTIDIWPRPLTLYGLMIGFGIIAATVLARPRLAKRRIHPDTAIEMLMWVVPAGVIGARLYHVVTDAKPLNEWIEIWNGGLGIPGAIAGGAIGALLFIRNRDLPKNLTTDAIVPGIPLAQAIGRWGNWWNQELYGSATDLPWGLEIDRAHWPRTVVDGRSVIDQSLLPEGVDAADTSINIATFHPTFLYESLWNLGIVAVLLWIDRRGLLKTGKLVWVYTGLYAIGRLWIEAIRIDPATEILGLRVNLWLMGLILLVSGYMLRNARADKNAVDAAVLDEVAGDDDNAEDMPDDADDAAAASDEEE
jgi:prolipoprotein diacylglyceryl transferase